MLFEKVFEVSVENTKIKRDCLLAFNFSSLPLRSGVFSSLGTVGCLLPKEGDGFSIVNNVSNWTFGPRFSLQLIQSPVKSSLLLRFPSLK